MAAPHQRSDHGLLIAFAGRAAALAPDAWDRIAERCSRLDPSTVEAFLGRIELLARSITPEPDPYAPLPLIRSWFAAMGGAYGVIQELARLTPPNPEEWERTTRASGPGPAHLPEPGARAFMQIEALAQRQLSKHPGTATALRAVSLALLAYPKSRPASFDAIYKPFEPEIPFASLSPGEHAA
jgi:hypothetical protein